MKEHVYADVAHLHIYCYLHSKQAVGHSATLVTAFTAQKLIIPPIRSMQEARGGAVAAA